ncbi:hypothetical protein GCM10007989_10040 [Devosia pacifica]|uniref:Uncharacterized protein n=1 Tax=Devosia pacifica TaxID=1335967 RepID=A0A918VRH3_9HYPH|nr:hypothetical protein [Devosia pacifica]GHA16853.1 hypothetical protein GCM10007989_10040 [Devosia pacifica]
MQQIRALAAALAGAIISVSAIPAHAALPPGVVDYMLAEAPIDIEVKILSVETPDRPDGSCLLEAIVTKVYEGDLASGQTIEFTTPCYHPGAELPVGGASYRQVKTLTTLQRAEVLLVPEGAIFTVAGYGAGLYELERSPPFFGTWECGGHIFSFGEKLFDNGDEAIKIEEIEQTAAGYRLHLREVMTPIELTGIEAETMRYATNTELVCTRLPVDRAQ